MAFAASTHGSAIARPLLLLSLLSFPSPTLLAFPSPTLLAEEPSGREATRPASAPAASVLTRERTVTRVADGVYVIRHRDGPDTNPQGNTTVVVGSKGVLVVDSGYLPSSAREDIAQIRRWTRAPVRWLVNTHWHPDHIRGNEAYSRAFPGVDIIAQERTPELERGFDEPNLVRYRARVTALRRTLESGRKEDGSALTDTERAEAAATLEGRSRVMREFERYVPVYPNVTFADHLTLDLGGRTARVERLGAGHTVGDAIVVLPEEKIVIAGDLVAHPVPYFFAGYPYDEIESLEQLLRLEARVLVPGHGAVQYDMAFVHETLALLRDVRDQVVAEVRRRGSLSAKLEDVRKAVDFHGAEERFAGRDPDNLEFFQESMDGLVRTLFEQVAK